MASLATVILAAGKGERMKSRTPKVLHCVAGQPMITYPLRRASQLKSKKTVVVVGHGGREVEMYVESLSGTKVRLRRGQGPLKHLKCVGQRPQLGTAHAVWQTRKALKGFGGDVLILYGDVPLISVKTLKSLVQSHRRKKQTLTLLNTFVPNPFGYGRVLRGEDGSLQGIVEEKNATVSQKRIREIYSGIMVIKSSYLFSRIPKIKKNKVKKEYYITDLIEMAVKGRERIGTVEAKDFLEVRGINSMEELSFAEDLMQERLQMSWMTKGVCFQDSASVKLGVSVQLSPDVVIGPQVSLRGRTRIGRGTFIDQGSVIEDSVIGEGVHVQPYSVIEESRVDSKAKIGPFAHLRPLSKVGPEVHIGNFVELKKTHIKKKAKANHLSYLGDAIIGEGSNIGAGTITCNYDGQKKHVTKLGKGVFVGSDTQFVAPVTVGAGAYIGAGSTITENVPAESLALSRAPQRNVPQWTRRRKKKSK